MDKICEILPWLQSEVETKYLMCLSSVPQSYLGSHIGLGSSQQQRLDVGPKLRIWRWFQDWFPECPGSSTPRGLKVALFRVPCCHLDSLGRFNQKLTLPSSLSLTFGDKFNQSLVGVIFPSSLQSLTFGHQFNLSVVFPWRPPPPQSQSKGWSVLQLWIYQNVWLKVVVSLFFCCCCEWRRVYELESVLSCLCTDCHLSSPLLQTISVVSPLFDIYHPHSARYIFPLLLALSPSLITWVCPKTRYPQIWWFIMLSHVIISSILIKIAIADHKCWVYVVYTIFRHTLLSIIWYPR